METTTKLMNRNKDMQYFPADMKKYILSDVTIRCDYDTVLPETPLQ